MAEKFRFFNSTLDDPREYLASEFSEYFGLFLSDGVYTENGRVGLGVIPGANLSVIIETGYALIRGYMYQNDSNLGKVLSPAHNMFDRIDRVVLRFDEIARKINISIKTGTPSSSPQLPSLELSDTIKELGLAQVRVRKGSTVITAVDLTDERLTDACGLVSSLIEIPVQEMWDVWNGELNEIKTAWESWFSSVQNETGIRLMVGSNEPVDKVSGDVWLKVLS